MVIEESGLVPGFWATLSFLLHNYLACKLGESGVCPLL